MRKVIKLSGNPIQQSFDQWKRNLIVEFGAENIEYNEVGADGWDQLQMVAGEPSTVHNENLHWVDAIPCNNNPLAESSKLLGTYYHNNQIGKYFYGLCEGQ